jgi:hypothetical protein
MTVEDYIIMVRLWNAIGFCRLGPRTPLFPRYSATFFPAYVERISKTPGAQPAKGMAPYSKKYNLYLGGKPHQGSQVQDQRGRWLC